MNLDELLNNSIGDAVSDTFSTVLSLNPVLQKSNDLISSTDFVKSTILLKGDFSGSISIFFGMNSACTVVSKMLGMEITPESFDVLDGVGEILNILVGGTKTILNKKNCKINISIPSTTKISEIKSINSENFNEGVRTYGCENILFQMRFKYKGIFPVEKKQEKPEEGNKEKVSALSAFEKLSMLVEKTREESVQKK